jgi:SAM-dependent methyltransferase
MDAVRKGLHAFARTPLHPQWLLGSRRVPVGMASVSGALLDIGAADRWIEPVLPAGVQYVALDYPTTGHDLYGATPHVFADAVHLPFPNGSFNAVICLEVLEHVPDPAIVVNEIARVLTPGGRAWISMPFLYPLHDAPFDFQRYTEFGLRRDIQRAGLEIVTFQRSCHAIRAAGLLMCLAVAGGLHVVQGWRRWLLLPLGMVAIVSINVVSWLTSLFWPDWSHLTKGHELEVRKP